MVSCGMKTCSESRIELQKQQILKKMQEKSWPSEPKSLDVALNTAGVERVCLENLRLWTTLIDYEGHLIQV